MTLDHIYHPTTGEHFAYLNPKTNDIYCSKSEGRPKIGALRDGKIIWLSGESGKYLIPLAF